MPDEHTDHCPNCGRYASTETEDGFCDFDWTYRYPTFAAYCNEQCADQMRAKTDPATIAAIEKANG